LIRFGVFEANLETGELRKLGSRIKVQEQPFQILAMLLERQAKWSPVMSCTRRFGALTPLSISNVD
jgi:hypothetical protein